MMGQPENPENDSQNLLTSGHDAYTLASTNEQDADETERIMVQNFLRTLAELALAVASRKAGGNPGPKANP